MPTIPQTLIIVIPGRPVTKKNSPVMIAGRNLILPSKSYRKYKDFCIGTKKNPGWLMQWGNIQFSGPVRIDALYYLPNLAHFPDLCGLFQATGDILEAAGIIENDRNIVSWGVSRIAGIDKENPRVEITISETEKGWE